MQQLQQFNTIVGVNDPGPTPVYRWDGSNTFVRNLSVTAQIPVSEYREYVKSDSWHRKTPYDGASWAKIKASGEIKMTPYFNKRYEVANHLAEIHRSVADFLVGCMASTSAPYGSKRFFTKIGTYGEQGDYDYWNERFNNAPSFKLQTDNLDVEVESLKSRLVADTLNQFDALTELAEVKDTFETIKNLLKMASRPLESFASLLAKVRRNPKENIPKELADKWLETQYAIMPLMFSIKDALELHAKRNDSFVTTRVSNKLDGEFEVPDLSSTCFYQTGIWGCTIRGTSRSRYSSDALTKIAESLTVNPSLTLWELTPFSVIVDWFLNVGEWLLAQTFSFNDFAVDRKFCYSIKTESHIFDFLHIVENGGTHVTYPDYSSTPGLTGCGGGIDTYIGVYNLNSSHMLREMKIQEYERFVFQPTDVQLTWSPFLDWKRWTTAFALSISPLISTLKRLT